MRLTANPCAVASGEMIVGGSWQWSPARTIRSARSTTGQLPGSVLWQASSITAKSNLRFPSMSGSKLVVAQITSARSSTLAMTCLSKTFASSRSRRDSWRSSFRWPGIGLALVNLLAFLEMFSASRIISPTTFMDGSDSTCASRVKDCNSSWTRAGCPIRTTRTRFATSFSSRLSTPVLLGAQARTFEPRKTACRINSTTVVVLPVPGGP